MTENTVNMQSESFEKSLSWLEDELAQRTAISSDTTGIIFIGLVNRTNTGALATALGRSPLKPPITRHIQPFKAIARQLMEARGIKASTPLTFLKDHIELVPGINLIKETIGPNKDNPSEWVDSLKILLLKGVDPKKVVFVPTFRDPLDTVASWKFMWGWDWETFPFDSFNKSFQIVSEKIKLANKIGIEVVPYTHEFLRDYDRFTVIQSMCNLIKIPFSPNMVQWESSDAPSDDKNDPYFDGTIIKYDIPPDRWVRGALSIEHGGRGGLVWKPIASKLQMHIDEKNFVSTKIQPAIEIHNHFVSHAKDLLGL